VPCQISGSALGRLIGLLELDLQHTSVSDISALGGLIGLEELSLSRCSSVSDISPFRRIKGLCTLNLQSCSSVSKKQIARLRRAVCRIKIETGPATEDDERITDDELFAFADFMRKEVEAYDEEHGHTFGS
jgi:hypothetical protein